MKKNMLKEAIDKGKVMAGMALYTASPALVEVLGYSGFDFVFVDTEHSPLAIDINFEHVMRAANAANIAVVVRVKCNDEAMIRNAFEAGASAVCIPHIKSAEDVKRAVQFAKFPPKGIRGASSDVRSACYGAGDFDWPTYIQESNEDTLIIPLAEDTEFFDNIDSILDVEGISAINFGPTDLSMSIGIPLLYQLDNPKIKDYFNKLTSKAKEKNIPLLCPVAPPTLEKAQELVDKGVRMLIFRNDIVNFRGVCQGFIKDIVNLLKSDY